MKEHLPIVEKLLQQWHTALGPDYTGYRNHVYRVVNLVHHFYPAMSETDAELLEVAAAFHDIGIWLDHTFDYLEPSADRASAWLAENPEVGEASLERKQRQVRALIMNHHKVRAVPDTNMALAEAFRKADWVDVSFAGRLAGVPKQLRKSLKAAFPDAGFHKRLVQLTWDQVKKKPGSPLPMMRW
ncbi:MAG: HD domain-containing protein [Marinobacter sp.]|nr:HD domain-containing protein [Marinobacter sp.]